MLARIRLSLLVTAVILLGVIAVLALARTSQSGSNPGAGIASADSPFAGATRPAVPSPDFRLVDQDDREATLADVRGQVAIVTFLYANCDDTCPAAARQIAGALDQLDTPAPVLIVSVDPDGDTAAATQRFLRKMRLAGRARFLRGDRATLRPVWNGYAIEPQGPKFDHSAYVLVLDGEGRQRVSFPVGHLTSEGLAHDVRLLRERERTAHHPTTD